MAQFHELRVSNLKKMTQDALEITFEVPDNIKSEFHFVAGQYLILEKIIAGKSFRRSYSISSSPESEELKVIVKRIPKGMFSAWVHMKLKIGGTLNVFLPQGRFTYSPSPEASHTYAAFAAGSGITPIMAILQSVLISEPKSKFILVYGNKTPEQTIYYEDLKALQVKYINRLHIEFVYSRMKKKKSFRELIKQKVFRKNPEPVLAGKRTSYGRIGNDTVNRIVKKEFKNDHIVDFYLCGPIQMIEMATEVLEETGVPKEHIHHELFVPTEGKNNKKSDESIQTGKTKVTVILDDEEVTFEMDRRQRVLDAIRDAGLDPPYSCEGGICSSCLAQIKEGSVEMANNQILTDDEVADGLALTCQSHPTSPTLIVDYDDV